MHMCTIQFQLEGFMASLKLSMYTCILLGMYVTLKAHIHDVKNILLYMYVK